MIVADIPSEEYSTTAVAYYGDEIRHAGGLPYGEERDANAAFIIRACNSHYALIAALSQLHDNLAEYQRINNLGGYDNQDMRQARDALELAMKKG